MIKILTLIPTIIGVIKSAHNLKGATTSNTTTAQWKGNGAVFFILCVIVVCLGMIPGSPLADVALQASAVAILTPILGPLLSRMIRLAGGDTAKVDVPAPPVFNEEIMDANLCRVKRKSDKSWTAWSGNAMDAWAEGWELGVDRGGGAVWDLTDGVKTDQVVRLPDPAADPEQKKRVWAKVKAALKENAGKGDADG